MGEGLFTSDSQRPTKSAGRVAGGACAVLALLAGCVSPQGGANPDATPPPAATASVSGSTGVTAARRPSGASLVSDEDAQTIAAAVAADSCDHRVSEAAVRQNFADFFLTPEQQASLTTDELLQKIDDETAAFERLDNEIGHIPLPAAHVGLQAALDDYTTTLPEYSVYEDLLRGFVADHGIDVVIDAHDVTTLNSRIADENAHRAMPADATTWTAYSADEKSQPAYRQGLLDIVRYFHDLPREEAEWVLTLPHTLVVSHITTRVPNAVGAIISDSAGLILTLDLPLRHEYSDIYPILDHELSGHAAVQGELCGFLDPVTGTNYDNAQLRLVGLEFRDGLQQLGTLDQLDSEEVPRKAVIREYISDDENGTDWLLYAREISAVNSELTAYDGYADSADQAVTENLRPLQLSITYDLTRLQDRLPESTRLEKQRFLLNALNDIAFHRAVELQEISSPTPEQVADQAQLDDALQHITDTLWGKQNRGRYPGYYPEMPARGVELAS